VGGQQVPVGYAVGEYQETKSKGKKAGLGEGVEETVIVSRGEQGKSCA